MAESSKATAEITKDIEESTIAKDQCNGDQERALDIDDKPNSNDERLNDSSPAGNQEQPEQEPNSRSEDPLSQVAQDSSLNESMTNETLEQLEQLIRNKSMKEFRKQLQEVDTHWCDIGGICGEGLYEGTLIHQLVRLDPNGIQKDISLLCEKNVDINQADLIGQTPLHLASELGKEKTVKALLDNKADINATNQDQNTPLFIALMNGNDTIVEILMKDKETPLDLAHTNEKGQNILHLACIDAIDRKDTKRLFNIFQKIFDYLKIKGQREETEAIFNCKAMLDCIIKQKVSPATIGFCLADNKTLDMLLITWQMGVIDGNESLFTRVVNVRGTTTNKFLKKGCEQSLENLLDFKWTVSELKLMLRDRYMTQNARHGKSGKTLLHMVCEKGCSIVVMKLLLEETRDIDEEGPSLETPLNLAIRSTGNQSVEILRQLLMHGALVNVKTNEALRTAVEKGEFEKLKVIMPYYPDSFREISKGCLEDLFKNNAIANVESCKRLSRLHEVNPREVLEFLREWRDDGENNALQWALKHDSEEMFRLVLRCRAVDIMTKNNEGKTILHVIKEKYEKSVLQFVRSVDYDATELLIRAMEENKVHPTNLKYKDIELILQNRHFDVNYCYGYDENRTLLHMFCNLGMHPSIVELLLKAGANTKTKDGKSYTPLRLLAKSKGTFTIDILKVLAGHGTLFSGNGYDKEAALKRNKEDAIVYLFYEGPVAMLEQMFIFKPERTIATLNKLFDDNKRFDCNGIRYSSGIRYTYIRHLVRNGKVELLKFILEKNKTKTESELREKSGEGRGLHLACGKNSSLEMIRLILELGFNPAEETSEQINTTPMQMLETLMNDCTKKKGENTKERELRIRRKTMAQNGIELFKAFKSKKADAAKRSEVSNAKEEIIALLNKHTGQLSEDFDKIKEQLNKLTEMASFGIVTAISPPMLDVFFHEMAMTITEHTLTEEHRLKLMHFLLSDCGAQLQKYFQEELDKLAKSEKEKLYYAIIIWKSTQGLAKGKIGLLNTKLQEFGLDELSEAIKPIEKKENERQQWVNLKGSILSDKGLSKLAKEVSANWRELGTNLEMEKNELDEIRTLNLMESDKGFEMLIKWRRASTESDASKISILLHAMREMKRNDLVKFVQDFEPKSATCNVV